MRLSPGVPEGIRSSIAAAAADPAVAAIVVIGAGRTFIAGADIREFGKVVSGEKPRLSLLPLLLRNRGLREAGGHGDPRHRVRRRPGSRHGGALSRAGARARRSGSPK